MTEAKAAGPKTELIGVSPRMQQSIEDLIASLTDGVGDCLQNARTVVSQSAYDDTRSSERRDAVQIASTAAEVLASIAKLKGGFSHDYRITRTNEPPPEKFVGWNGNENELLVRDEYDALSEMEQVDYDRWTNGIPPKYAGWKRPNIDTPQTRKRDRQVAEAEAAKKGAATPSPLQNRGSNTQSPETQEKGGDDGADAG